MGFPDGLDVLLRERGDPVARRSEVRLLVKGDGTTCRWALEQAVVGAASVAALRAAITGHGDGGAFGWLRRAGRASNPTSLTP